ncbi:MAG: hypothetical protein K1X83_06070 [Oligoflexia bacterium]|nr:hypothetical protein [Oligoflexia bacterium]
MANRGAVVKFEFFNVLRSRWLLVYFIALAASTIGLARIVDDPRKTQLALLNVVGVLCPLVSVLFAVTYWYSSERFTELMLSQPVSRGMLFWSRLLALSGSLTLCSLLGILLPGLFCGLLDGAMIWLLAATGFLSVISSMIGALIAVYVQDRMRGIGLALGLWFYAELLHDGIALTALISLRDYPLDLAVGIWSALNPVCLTRVAMLLRLDAPLLLGHSGALVRNLAQSDTGLYYAAAAAMVWLAVPVCLASRHFRRRDL